jgi:large subunit ribosomal protein L32
MAVPKRRLSKRRTAQRNSHAALAIPERTKCGRCAYLRPPHRVCPNCGYYGDREVVVKD